MSDLKRCPFCGSALIGKSYLSYAHDCTCIECNDCHARCNICGTLEDASYAWNNRAESSDLANLREQVKVLREALEACIDLLSNLENIGGFVGLAVINNGQTALEQTKSKDGE